MSIDFQTAWLIFNDEDFLRQNADLQADVYPRGPLRYLVRIALEAWNNSHATISDVVVRAFAESDKTQLRRDDTNVDDAVAVFDAINGVHALKPGEVKIIRPKARAWLERRQMLVAHTKSGPAIDRGDLDKARQIMDSGRLQDHLEDQSASLDLNSPDFLNAVVKRKKGYVSFGFTDVDDLWDGGYRRGELGMVLGSTGVGKSMILSYLSGVAVWRGKHVMYYTTELTADQIKERVALSILEKGKNDLRFPWAKEIALKCKQEHKDPANLGRLDVYQKTMPLLELEADLEDYKSKHGKYPDVLMLDSPDDFGPIDTRKTSAYETLKETYTWLRSLVQKKKLRCWTSGQLNRDAVEKARISLRNIGDSYAKAWKCHYVIGFSQSTQEANSKKEGDGKPAPKMAMYILKDSLHGSNGNWFELEVEYGPLIGQNGYAGFGVKLMHRPGD